MLFLPGFRSVVLVFVKFGQIFSLPGVHWYHVVFMTYIRKSYSISLFSHVVRCQWASYLVIFPRVFFASRVVRLRRPHISMWRLGMFSIVSCSLPHRAVFLRRVSLVWRICY